LATRKDGVVRSTTKIGIVAGVLVAVAVTFAITLSAFASPQDEGGADPGLRGQWELQSATDAGGTIPLANQLITLTIGGDNTTTGRSTCSNYRAHVYGSLASLWVTATLPKAEHCGIQAQQDIEQRYINDLNRVRTSTLVGGVLNADSYYATTNPLPVIEHGATLTFSKQGTLTGTTGCEHFTASYTENAGEIVLGKLHSHKRGQCSSHEQAIDTYVVSVIDSGFTFVSGLGELGISSPRAEITLAFTD
jgi:heat shock protein HslJ